jgi:adenylate cyclase
MAHAATITGQIGGRRQRIERLVSERLAEAFRAEELAGLKLATRAKLIALAVIAFWLFVWVTPPRVFFLETILALFALCALLHYRLTAHAGHASPTAYVFGAIDMALLTFSMVGYDLLIGDRWPAPMMLRNGTFVYFLLFLALVALSYSSRLVLWCGACGALSWIIGVGLIVGQRGTLTSRQLEMGRSADHALAIVLDPHYVDLDVIVQDVVVLLLVAGVLAAGARRSRRLVLRQAVASRERANLARYFSPRIVDRLAQADEPLAQVRAQPVAVLFADIVGFTRLSEREAPERVVLLLREFHARLEQAVFEHDGTLDKYLGDGVMATFGTPDAGPGDAANALAAARAMLADIATWNHERVRAGETAVRLSIGIHYGEVVLGDIGSERRLEFAVLGDVVNVASRLESLTRELGSPLVVSDALVAAVRASPTGAPTLAGLHRAEPQHLRGRDQPVAVWILEGGLESGA